MTTTGCSFGWTESWGSSLWRTPLSLPHCEGDLLYSTHRELWLPHREQYTLSGARDHPPRPDPGLPSLSPSHGVRPLPHRVRPGVAAYRHDRNLYLPSTYRKKAFYPLF